MDGDEFRFFVALLCVIAKCAGSQNVGGQATNSSISIEEGDFLCKGNLLCSGDATTDGQGLLKLTPYNELPPSQNQTLFDETVGVALCDKPVQLLDPTTNQVASLSIAFSFRIEPGQYGQHGDGIALVMFANETWIGSRGSNLGAYKFNGRAGVETLAVEFDTRMNRGIDDDDNHVGIDTTSTKSLKAKRVPFPLEVDRVYAWVDYNPLTATLEIRVHNASEKPEQPFISYTMDLRDVFDSENVWVGFSGANGGGWSFYTVYDMHLKSSFPSLSARATATPAPKPEPTSQKSSVSTGLIASVTVGVAAIVLGGCLLSLCARRKRTMISGDSECPPLEVQEKQFAGLLRSSRNYNYDELCAATADFSDAFKLGEGGFGSVYRGSIPGTSCNPEVQVAVKKLSSESKQGEREFLAELSTIGMLRHRNIVQLLGWCCDGPGKCLLIYEFMPNGSLDRHLYPRAAAGPMSLQQAGQEYVLSWEKRFKILGGLAAALQHLHEGWRQQVIHRDVKSSNVMLDDNLNAVLGDFGLGWVADHYENPATTAVAGTRGYLAPEASMSGKFTVKTDVYAFGAVCLETVCGRKVSNRAYPTDEIFLLDHVWRKLSEVELFSVVDKKLEGNYDVQQVEVALLLGLWCSHLKPDERPAMHRVVEILAGSVEMPPIPQAEYYSYSHSERKKIYHNFSGSGIEHQYQLNSSESYNSDFTAYSNTRPRTGSSHTSGLTSPGSTIANSSKRSYAHVREAAAEDLVKETRIPTCV